MRGALEEVSVGELGPVLLIDVLKVEVLGQDGRHDLQVSFRESLTEASTGASAEGHEGRWVPLLAFWR